MSYKTNDDLVKSLMALGLADPVTGNLLTGALVDPSAVVGAVTQNTDNVLNTVSLSDELLAQGKRGLLIFAFGTLAANGNTKDIKLFLGTDVLAVITDSTASGKDFAFMAVLFRVSADVQIGFAWVTVDGALVAASSINFAGTTDENVTQTIKTTGNNNSAAASAATGKGLVVIPFTGTV